MMWMFIIFIFLQDSNKAVKGTPFPSVTICTEGVNMDAVMDSVKNDFNEWMMKKKNQTYKILPTEKEHRDNVKEFLYDIFNISPSYNISIEDIALAYSSPEPDRWKAVISRQFESTFDTASHSHYSQ